MKYDSIRDAAEHWVGTFNAIPQAMVEKAYARNGEWELNEITPASHNDHVYIYEGEHNGEYGYIVSVDSETGTAMVSIDGKDKEVEIEFDSLDVQRDGSLPMWGWLWTFGESVDDWWLEDLGGLQLMANCGFRIYETEEGYLFGIDGAGYDFYDEHWIPLYKARGLQWHREEGAA